ncbi:MAG: response regulator [Desulfamplus sp.]|nr:response regulator [Desulfamplus sp.]
MKMTKIMIIETEPDTIKELEIHLGYINCDIVSVVDSGEKALKALNIAQPDVILMDIELNMGRKALLMEASECAKQIRNLYHIPIVFIVGDSVEGSLSKVELDFPFGYLLTPISTRELKVTIDVAIYTAKIDAERIKAQSDLKDSDERYKTLFENIISGIAIYKVIGDGDDFIFLDLNKAGEKIEKQKREELIGKSIFEARPAIREFGLIDTFKKVLNTGKPHHHPVKLYQDDRISGYYDNYVYKLSSGELVVLFRDETLKKRAEEDMKRLESQLNQAQKMEAIGTMAGGIAHDFNNILFPIIGCAELLIEDSKEGSTQREFLNEILRAGNRAKELVKQILTFSRQEHHEVAPLSVLPIVKEIIKLSRAMIPSTIVIKQNIPKSCCMVMADPTQMHQVFMNLIINAFHAMEDTGGVLSVGISEFEKPFNNLFAGGSDFDFSDLSTGRYLCIEVSDTGIGMDQVALKRIFEPYFTTKEIGKGTGLGLSVVHGIVKSCKGKIVVNSEPGKGSTFKVYLPCVEEKKVDMVESSPIKRYTGKETILVVDDEPVVVRMLKLILERSGYKALIHTDSLEALKSFGQEPEIYDLVITDLTMPGITGEKLCASIKMIKPDIPVILCTGFSTKVSDLQSSDFKIDRVIMKPIISQELLKTVRELLDSIDFKSQ